MANFEQFTQPELTFKVDLDAMTATDENGVQYELDASDASVYKVNADETLSLAPSDSSAAILEAFRRATIAEQEMQNKAAVEREEAAYEAPVAVERNITRKPKGKVRKIARVAMAATLITAPVTVPVVGYTAGRVAASFVPGADDFNLPTAVKDGFGAEKDFIVSVFTSEEDY